MGPLLQCRPLDECEGLPGEVFKELAKYAPSKQLSSASWQAGCHEMHALNMFKISICNCMAMSCSCSEAVL